MTARYNRDGGRNLETLLDGEVSPGVFETLQDHFMSGETRAGVTIFELEFALKGPVVSAVVKGTRIKGEKLDHS